MIIKRCISCMEDMSSQSASVCPRCGFDNADPAGAQLPYAMKPNTIIHGRYLVGRVLGQGGFGITYIGFDLVLNVKVAIKEYFPMGMAAREQGRSNSLIWSPTQINTQQRQDGYDNFLKEARKTAKIDSIPSIVRVRDTFLENETAYIVMDFVEGVTLKETLTRNGTMTVSECIRLLSPMMEGLAQVHKMGIIHRDISPDNIIVQPDGGLKLLDLGAAKDMASGQGQSQLVTKKGFSPLEQYAESGKIGPWTDVYALCATIYYCITGRMIPSAIDRMGKGSITFPMGLKEDLPANVEEALKAGLETEIQNRIQNVDELLERLKGNGKTPGAIAGETGNPGTGKKGNFTTGTGIHEAKGGSGKKILAGGAAALLAVAVITAAAVSKIKSTVDTNVVDSNPGTEPAVRVDVTPEAELDRSGDSVRVQRLGTSSANMFNYGGNAAFDKEYEYFIAGDNALYVCAYNTEDKSYYPDSESVKVSDHAGYITLSDTDVYFLACEDGVNAVFRMDKDGSNIRPLYSGTDGRDFQCLQYVEFSDQGKYLYFLYANQEGSSFYTLLRYNLETEETETVIEGDVIWYTLYQDAVYYTEVTTGDDVYIRLARAGLDGGDPEELDRERRFTYGFIEEDTLYLFSARDQAILACDLDGTPKSGYEGFYNLNPDLESSFGYGDGWIYYTDVEDRSIHRVRANGTGDCVFLEGHTAVRICYRKGWLWFIEAGQTEKRNQYRNQMYYVYEDGTSLLKVGDENDTWALGTANPADFQWESREEQGGIVITGYTGELLSFEIPDQISGETVVGIGEGAFQESGVEEIGLPESVKVIEKNAFRGCASLTFVGMSEGLEEIGFGAFGECEGLEYVDFPESLIRIGGAAFALSSLGEVFIPANVEEIGSGAFAVLSSAELTEFEVSEENSKFFTIDGVLYQSLEWAGVDGTLLYECPSGYSGYLDIPDSVYGINDLAFAYCAEVTGITIPEDVIVIGNNAFMRVGFSEITVNRSCQLPEDLGDDDIKVNYY